MQSAQKQDQCFFVNKEDQTPKAWEFQEHLVFKHFDEFLNRLLTLEEFFLTAIQFLKLEKVEIGGLRVKLFTNHVKKIFEEFKELYRIFGNRTYVALNPNDKYFLNGMGSVRLRLRIMMSRGSR